MCHITVGVIVTQSHRSGHLGWKGPDVVPAACICSMHTQSEPWEAGSSGLFPRQLILSKVNVCKNVPSTGWHLTLLSSWYIIVLSGWDWKECHGKHGRKVDFFCVWMCLKLFWLHVSYVPWAVLTYVGSWHCTLVHTLLWMSFERQSKINLLLISSPSYHMRLVKWAWGSS